MTNKTKTQDDENHTIDDNVFALYAGGFIVAILALVGCVIAWIF